MQKILQHIGLKKIEKLSTVLLNSLATEILATKSLRNWFLPISDNDAVLSHSLP